MHGLQNNFAQLLSSIRRSAVPNICLRRLKVKVTKELVRAITGTFMHGLQNILHSCCLREEEMPFKTFVYVG